MTKYYLIIFLFFISSCKRVFDAPVPSIEWDLFDSPVALALHTSTQNKMEGVYGISKAENTFGTAAAIKWSYTAAATDTIYHLSFFCEKDAAYFISEGKRLNGEILLNGYWRKLVSTETGRVRLTITATNGAAHLLNTNTSGPGDSIIISGVFGIGDAIPDRPITLKYLRPLFNASSFEILAHRGGGRNADLLPASENSLEMLQLASRFGATGVEIDVRLTSDGIPVLYHDATLNDRLIQKSGILGPIENFSFDQLHTIVRLKRGGRIPTLEEALKTIIYHTPLRFVWLDIKYIGSLQKVRDLQIQYLQAAAAIGRNIEIVIGIPEEDVLNNFKQLNNFLNVPSLIELSPAAVIENNAVVWAPSWTNGFQNDAVANIQAQGKRAFVWTVDGSENISRYMYDAFFNGILSNQPSLVAYYHYVRQ